MFLLMLLQPQLTVSDSGSDINYIIYIIGGMFKLKLLVLSNDGLECRVSKLFKKKKGHFSKIFIKFN